MSQVQERITSARFGSFSLREISILVALMVPTALALIDSGMLAVALPVIQEDFDLPVDLLSWAVAASFVSRVTLQPVYGRVGDMLGKKQLFLTGLAVFAAGAVMGIVAPSFGWLIGGRLLQGVGGASFPLTVALIVDAFPKERRGRALGIWNAAAPVGIILGPVIGGFVVEGMGWHAIFVFVAAGTVASLLVVSWLIPTAQQARADKPFDWIGAASLTLFIASTLLASTTSSVIPFGSSLNWLLWGVAGLAVLSLIRNAVRRADPFIGFDVVRNRRFVSPALAVNLRMFAHDGGRFLMVLYLANVFGLSPKTVGLFMLFYTVPLLVGVTYGGFLADRWDGRTLGMRGMLALAAGLLWLGLAGDRLGSLGVAPGMVVAGIGGGACLVSFTKEAVVALGEGQVGLASGLYNTVRFAGSAAATPLLGLLLAYGFAQAGGLETTSGPYQQGFQVVAVVAALGIAAASFIPTAAFDEPQVMEAISHD